MTEPIARNLRLPSLRWRMLGPRSIWPQLLWPQLMWPQTLREWRLTHTLRALAVVAFVSMLAAGAEFIVVVHRESQLVNRFSDLTWWMTAQFRAELQQFHISLAGFDNGGQDALDEVHERYDILLSRIKVMAESTIEPKPGPELGDVITRLCAGVLALGPRVDALGPTDLVGAARLAADMPELDRLAGRMTTLGAQADAEYREAVRAAIGRANVVFALALVLLIGSLLLSLRALNRQARARDEARRRSETLSGDLAAALAQAQAGSRAKNAFLATMSHEIRTPMNGVLGAVSLLVNTELSEQQRRWVAIVKSCGEALLAQLDDVLDFSALEAASVRLELDAFDIRALAEDAMRVVEGAANESGLDLVVVVDPDVPDLLVSDRRRVGQVLLNLLTNAVKFTAAGGVLMRISLRRRGDTAWLRAAVVDSGPGIPREDRRRIFQEFTRLNRAGERMARGTGLGLAISLRIATALGGQVRVAAAAGGGSVFWISVPVAIPPRTPSPRADAGKASQPSRNVVPMSGTAAVAGGVPCVRHGLERLLRAAGYTIADPELDKPDLVLRRAGAPGDQPAAQLRALTFGPGGALASPITLDRLQAVLAGTLRPPRGAAAVARPAPGQGLWLLVADDEPINREIAASLLRHLGHEVVTVADGLQALDAVRSAHFDAVLVDLYMPLMDGAEFARAVRALPRPVGAMRLIAVTADADVGIRESMLTAGIDAVLLKPVTLERLADALLSLTDRPRPPVREPRWIDAGPDIIDGAVRATLLVRLPDGRLPALLRTFWDGVRQVLEQPEQMSGGNLDRRLHTLAGSAGSLGYVKVTAVARQARDLLRQEPETAAALDAVYGELAAAVRADADLLPPCYAAEVGEMLAQARRGLPPASGAGLRGELAGALP